MSRKSCSQADSRPQRDQVVTTTTSGLPMLKPKCLKRFGAGSGNRTRVFSLEGCCSTIELYPRAIDPGAEWWKELDLNQRRLSQRIYSPSPLTTRASFQFCLDRSTFGAGSKSFGLR